MVSAEQFNREDMNDAYWQALIDDVIHGRTVPEVLSRDRHGRLRTGRVDVGGGGSVIIRLWSRSGWRSMIRRIAGALPPTREWRALNRLSGSGVRVPVPIFLCRIRSHDIPHTDAIVTEDIGECVLAMEYLKRKWLDGEIDEVKKFESDVVLYTGCMIDRGVIDYDHGLHNMLVTSSGELVRYDFEHARRKVWPSSSFVLYGKMLGCLVSSYIFALQPNTQRVQGFIDMILKELKPPRRVVRVAEKYMHRLLVRQQQQIGVETSIDFVWQDFDNPDQKEGIK